VSGSRRALDVPRGIEEEAESAPVLIQHTDRLGAVVGALVHLHLLKVLELDTRLTLALGSRDPGTMAFLALPLLLPWLQSELGTPVPEGGSGAFEAALVRRWTEYVDRLEELVPRAVVENLLSTLVPRIVQPS